MAQDQNLENAEVLIARNNDTGQVGAVTVEYAETLKCLGHSLRHLVYLAVEAVPHASDL